MSDAAPRPTGDLSLDDATSVLGASRRRAVVRELQYALAHEERGVDLSVVVDRITAAETGRAVDAIDADARADVSLSLIHVHLPKLVDHGVVTDTDHIKPGPNYRTARAALNALGLVIEHEARLCAPEEEESV